MQTQKGLEHVSNMYESCPPGELTNEKPDGVHLLRSFASREAQSQYAPKDLFEWSDSSTPVGVASLPQCMVRRSKVAPWSTTYCWEGHQERSRPPSRSACSLTDCQTYSNLLSCRTPGSVASSETHEAQSERLNLTFQRRMRC